MAIFEEGERRYRKNSPYLNFNNFTKSMASSFIYCFSLRKETCVVAFGLFSTALLLFLAVRFTGTSMPRKSEGIELIPGPFSGTDDDSLSSPIYGVIIDAGSTGSRLFVYKWRGFMRVEPVLDPQTKEPVSKKESPGLSSFAEQPKEAANYIKPLLDYASEFVPAESRPNTPVYIFATAGMRLLNKDEREGILSVLRRELPRLTAFKILADNIQVIEGEWEGVYCWIAVNYLLGRFAAIQQPSLRDGNGKIPGSKETTEKIGIDEDKRQKTVGIIDMGGASVQIAFEVPRGLVAEEVAAGTLSEGAADDGVDVKPLVELAVGHFHYRLFVSTFLGFGVNEAAKRYDSLVGRRFDEELQKRKNSTGKRKKIDGENKENANAPTTTNIPAVPDGCLPRQFYRVTADPDDVQFIRKGTGQWDQCVADLQALLFPSKQLETANKTEKSPKSPQGKPCLALGPDGHRHFFNGVEAPPVPLSAMEIYGFSEYWFSAEDVLALGGPYRHDDFERRARTFCAQRWPETKKKMRHHDYPKADGERLESQCFKSAWIHAVLHDGFCINEMQNHFQSALTLQGQEVQWTLGAIIFQMRDFPLGGPTGKGDDGDGTGNAQQHQQQMDGGKESEGGGAGIVFPSLSTRNEFAPEKTTLFGALAHLLGWTLAVAVIVWIVYRQIAHRRKRRRSAQQSRATGRRHRRGDLVAGEDSSNGLFLSRFFGNTTSTKGAPDSAVKYSRLEQGAAPFDENDEDDDDEKRSKIEAP